LVSDTELNFFVAVVTLSTVAFAFVALVLFVGAAFRRIGVTVRARKLASVMERWRLIFQNGVASDQAELSRIRSSEAFAVLNLWNDLHRVRGGRNPDTQALLDRLDRVGRVSDFGRVAKSLLRQGPTGDCVVALTTLGYLSSADNIVLVRKYAKDERGPVSFAAHRALVMISPMQIGVFVEALRTHEDWSPIAVMRFLSDLDAATISAPLCNAVATSDEEHALRLLRFLHLCGEENVHDTLLTFLKKARNTRSIASALQELGRVVRTSDRALLYDFSLDERPEVRLAAAEALVPIVGGEDEPVIVRLLSDGNARIRYCAARALLAMPSGQSGAEKLRQDTSDVFSRDILVQVLAETDLKPRWLPLGRESRSPKRTGGPFDRRTSGSMRRHK